MKSSGCILYGLTVVMVGLTLLACVWIGAVFMNPQGPFNPLKPPALDAVNDTPVPEVPRGTPTEAVSFPTLPPEWTATPSPQPPTGTPTMTRTPTPTATIELSPVGPTATVSETAQPSRTPTRTAAPRVPTTTPGAYPATSIAPPTATPGSGYP